MKKAAAITDSLQRSRSSLQREINRSMAAFEELGMNLFLTASLEINTFVHLLHLKRPTQDKKSTKKYSTSDTYKYHF